MIPDPSAKLPPDSLAALSLAHGRGLRAVATRKSQATWAPSSDRVDPVDTLLASNAARLPELVPIRIGRMLESPFAFLRGSAAVMAGDLATTPRTGSMVQLCGDAHLLNFGIYASPERRLVFDLNDFDETDRGPWEWDVKRLAASFVVASRENGYPEATSRDMARIVAWEYRRWIRAYAGMRALQVWYASIPIERIIERVERARERAGLDISIDEARRRDHLRALGKLSIKQPGGGWLIRDRPPLLLRLPGGRSQSGQPCRTSTPLPAIAGAGSPRPRGEAPPARRRPQGGRRRQRRDPLLRRPARRPGRGPLVLQVKEADDLGHRSLRPWPAPSTPG